ncbi:hypothetical protein ACIQWV_03260 [Streptomyces sp. NPDC098085]
MELDGAEDDFGAVRLGHALRTGSNTFSARLPRHHRPGAHALS